MTRASVVVPVYNHEDFVSDALASAADQSHDDVEIVCVDDGSRDASVVEVLDSAERSGRTVLVVPQVNAGAHAALNRGASLATGELLLFLNSDDRYAPSRVATFVRAWERDGCPDDFWGFSGVTFLGERGEVVDPAPLGHGKLSSYNYHATLGAWVGELLPWHNVMLTSGNLVVSRRLFDRVGGFKEHQLVHDWDMALRLLAVCDPLVVPLPLYAYRLHGANTFSTIGEEQAVAESLEVRRAFQQALLRRSTQEPYARHGTPFVDYLRAAVPMRVAFSGS
ncbi:MAG: glycosyltransferase [Mycobacteriales bacterium]